MPHKHLLRLWVGSIFLLVSLSVKNYLPVNALAQVDKLVPDAGGVIHYPAAPAPAVSSRAARLYLQSPAAELDPMAFDALTYGITRDYLNGGGDTLTWLSIYADEAWISVDPASLVIPPGETRSLTVYVDRYGLADGSHASTVRLLRDTGITDYFNVSMEVASFAMTGADFGCVEQAASYSLDLPQDRLEIPFSWQVEAQPSWLTNVTPSSGMVASGSGTETIHLDFTVDPAGQPAGQNSGYMLWTTTAGHYVFPFQATFGCAGRATWVWGQSEAIIEDWGGARGEFFDFLDAPHGSAANKINTVYLYIPGGYLTDPVRKATLHGFLQQAAYRGLQIHYMPPGEAKIWVVSDDLLLDGQAIIDLVLQFNAETSVLGERFKGIHLDIEPAENDGWSTHSQEYWGRFESLLAYGRQQIDAYNLAHTAISFGADLVTYQPWYGADVDGDGADYEDVFAYVDVLTTMDYSDHAYDQPEDLIYGSYGLITRVSPVLAYAESIGKSVVVGVETDNLTIKGNPHLKDWMTFYEEGYSPVMEYELGQLSAHFASQPAFWKVAIHPYGVYTRLNPSGGVPEDISPIATTTSHMNPGETKSIWVTLGSIVKVIRVVVGWQGSTVEASLFDPYGRVITPAEAENDPHISYYQGANFTVYYVSSPAVGVWEVQLYGADLPEGGEEVTLAVYASNTPKTFLPLAQYGNQPQPPGATRTPTSTPTRTPTRTLAPTATPYPSATPTVTPTPLSWNIVTVDIAGDVGYYASLGLDQFGYAHLSYIDFDVYALKYAYEDVAGWHTQIVDSDGGTYAALVVDPSNYPHISYAASSQLRYAYLDGTGWHTQVVDSGGLSAVNTSLVLDDSGYAHISYRNGVNGELRYAYQDSSGWHTQIVDNANQFASATSIHLDDSNYPHIGYYDQTNGYLMYAYLDAAGWHIQIVDGADQVGSSVSLRLDSNHYPHLSYYDSTNSDLKYAYQDASGWHIMVVDSEGNVGTFTSLRLDMNGYPHISYRDQGHGDLKYAYRDAAGWHIHTVDTQDSVGIYTSLVLDANGYPHIGYHDYTNGDLKYAWVSP